MIPPLSGSNTVATPADVATNYRITVIEDDAGDALLVEELLADTGLTHTIDWKQTLGTALPALATTKPDCVLLDLHLPDASGLSAIQAVEAACPTTAIVVLTGLAEAAAGERAVAGGAQDYLVKGQVTPDLLARVVRYAVHRKQAERASAELRENRLHAQENARLERGLLPAPCSPARRSPRPPATCPAANGPCSEATSSTSYRPATASYTPSSATSAATGPTRRRSASACASPGAPWCWPGIAGSTCWICSNRCSWPSAHARTCSPPAAPSNSTRAQAP